MNYYIHSPSVPPENFYDPDHTTSNLRYEFNPYCDTGYQIHDIPQEIFVSSFVPKNKFTEWPPEVTPLPLPPCFYPVSFDVFTPKPTSEWSHTRDSFEPSYLTRSLDQWWICSSGSKTWRGVVSDYLQTRFRTTLSRIEGPTSLRVNEFPLKGSSSVDVQRLSVVNIVGPPT